MEGNFVDGVHPELDGRYVKSCDESVMDILVGQNDSIASGLLYREKSYLHDYPHCWRTDHPFCTTPWIHGSFE